MHRYATQGVAHFQPFGKQNMRLIDYVTIFVTIVCAAVAAYSDGPNYRRPFPLPACPSGATIVLYGAVPPGILGAEAEEKVDWKPYLAKVGINLGESDYALFYKPARILAVATSKGNHDLLVTLFE